MLSKMSLSGETLANEEAPGVTGSQFPNLRQY